MSKANDPGIVSKGELAGLSKVTPGSVSQWFAEVKIRGPAIIGLDGMRASISRLPSRSPGCASISASA
ncbi:hypothetical protein FHS85_003913 [Rhodoligotrophos appendicifer]|uniref:hypothetical protein n=1 Tax=Rhodoligotrophos appendicifer TaxID=987056 RepID=UPI001185AF2A|nr:hypothetical protein [Rhodoligotrophos appendicifer]